MSKTSSPPAGSSPDAVPPAIAGGWNRRAFLKGLGTGAAAVTLQQARVVADEIAKTAAPVEQGPGAVPITLNINGEKKDYTLEPRVTLLEALRNHGPHTGAKEVCDRGTCGACTVLVNGLPIYACMKLAIDAQGMEITTIEGVAKGGELSNVQAHFVECDALMCGFCTPGFVLSVTALLQKNPKPSVDEIKHACSGNLCRCGTYPHILKAALRASGVDVPISTHVASLNYAQQISEVDSKLDAPSGPQALAQVS